MLLHIFVCGFHSIRDKTTSYRSISWLCSAAVVEPSGQDICMQVSVLCSLGNICVRVCEGYRIVLGGLELQVFAGVCRSSIIVLIFCRCSELGGGCRVLPWT